MREVVVLGAGLHRYGVFPHKSFVELGVTAIRRALDDAGCHWRDIEAVYCGTARLGMAAGHHICRVLGSTGLAMTNVENASASGSSALREAYLAVAAGAHDVVLALGVDKLGARPERVLQEDPEGKAETHRKLPVHAFAALARQYMQACGMTREQLAQVSVKNHYHASLNPYAHFQTAVRLEEVLQARPVVEPFTVLHCCPWDEGAAAVVVAARAVAARFTRQPCPTLVASVLQSIPNAALDPVWSPVHLTAVVARQAYARAGYGPEDLHLIELHDAFSIEEVVYYEALGLVAAGEGPRLIVDGDTTLAGRLPVNSSGGLTAMGHPLGPTGLGQIAEILWQMRRTAGQRQVARQVRVALAHMVGAGGVCAIHVLRL
ncbi:MAG: thiolase [Candidatus Tectimicrobiota bacterium]|nr:MAG: thiolase [Candidatus Tectomicrobia bacterium]